MDIRYIHSRSSAAMAQPATGNSQYILFESTNTQPLRKLKMSSINSSIPLAYISFSYFPWEYFIISHDFLNLNCGIILYASRYENENERKGWEDKYEYTSWFSHLNDFRSCKRKSELLHSINARYFHCYWRLRIKFFISWKKILGVAFFPPFFSSLLLTTG